MFKLSLIKPFLALVLLTLLSACANAQTINLSAISGVTVYATEAAALSGAADSRSAVMTYLAAQTPTASAPLTINCDGWVYMTEGFVYDNGSSASHVYYTLASGTTSAGIVFRPNATVTTPKLMNKDRVSVISAATDSDIHFSGLTFDYNYNFVTSSQPKSDATWGLSQGFVAAGVKQISFNNCSFLNPKTYSVFLTGVDDSRFIGCNVDVGATPKDATSSLPLGNANYDGLHYTGDCNHAYITNCTLRTWDDALPLNSQEVPFSLASSDTQNLYRSPWFQGAAAGLSAGQVWNGGTIQNVLIGNCTINDSWSGVRIINEDSAHPVNNVIVDGLSGDIRGNYCESDPHVTDAQNVSAGQAYTTNSNNISFRNIHLKPFLTFVPAFAGDGRFNFHHSFASNWIIDLNTCGPSQGDTAIPIPYVHLDTFTQRSNFNFGFTPTIQFTDTFARANTTPGTVGNGWLDWGTGNMFSIQSGKLNTVALSSGATNSVIEQPETVGDCEATADWILGSNNSGTCGLSILHSVYGPTNPTTAVDSAYGVTFREGTSSGTQQEQISRKITGVSTNFTNDTTLTGTIGHTYRVRAGHFQTWVYGEVTDQTAASTTLGGLDLYSDSYIGSNSTQGVTLSGRTTGSGTWNATQFTYATDTSLALSGLSVTCTVPSGGTATATASSLPAGAAGTVGVWTLTSTALGSAKVDPWGRITGLATSLTAPVNVTYAADGYTAGITLNPDGTQTTIPSSLSIAPVSLSIPLKTSGQQAR